VVARDAGAAARALRWLAAGDRRDEMARAAAAGAHGHSWPASAAGLTALIYRMVNRSPAEVGA
jgi:hypothetical protein